VSVLAPLAGGTAAQKLSPSRLSDQLETLNSDVDLAALNLAVQGKASFQLLESVTAATIERTIEGSSTLTITARDRDRALIQSGYIGKGLDCEIDGLWFRLWAWSKKGDDLMLTFIDREVAVLKEWPPTSQGAKMYRVWSADKFGVQTRFHFAKQLVLDVAGIVPIRFHCPAIGELVRPTSPADRAIDKGHGFPANGNVTVKGKKADSQQLQNLDVVLQTGESLNARRKVLIAAVAVVTQESTARRSATNGDHVGLFQQSAADGLAPATRDPATDATAFFEAAISDDKADPARPIAQLGDDVQVSGHPELYQQWVDEATATVDIWLGRTELAGAQEAIAAANISTPDPTAGQFIRGRLESPSAAARKHKQVIVATDTGNKVVVREDNWACLTRLAAEIGYRCFCVSGTVYFIDDYTLYHQRVAMTLNEASDGVDAIDPDYSQGKKQATIAVACRANRWQAPPGSVAAVTDLGPASGRWLVSTITRSLFDKAASVTLKKPVLDIPESAAPEHGSGQSSGTVYSPPKTSSPGESGARQAIVAAASKAIALQANASDRRYHYLQRRPMPIGLFAANPEYIDCSAFVTLCYKAAGVADPNGRGYDGSGNTATLVANAFGGADLPSNIQLADLVFYGGTETFPDHVALYMGDGQIANMGSEGEPALIPMDDPGLPGGGKPLFILGYDLTPDPSIPKGAAR
jgi:cell wall-associated NlpC family hydrolase